MHKNTSQKIIDSALILQQLMEIPDELLKIAEYIAEPKHKSRVKAIARFLKERVVPLLDEPLAVSCLILQLISKSFQTSEMLAKKVGKSTSYAQQIIYAFKKGGIDVVESEAKGYSLLKKR